MTSATIGELYDRAVLHGGQRVAVSDGSCQLTFAELGENAKRLAAALQELGIGPGARVAFLMANCAEYVFCEYAVAKIGATRVPLAVLLANDDLASILNFARCDLVIYHERLAARLHQIMPALQTVRSYLCVGDGSADLADGHLSLRSMLASHTSPMKPVAIAPEDIASIYFTGGTTGRPKGVMLSHRSWYYTYYAEMLEFGIANKETFVFVTPMTHASGCLILPVLLRQGRCVVLDHFDPELLLGTIQEEHATATLVVPTMLYALLDHPARGGYDLSSLRNVLYGASAIAPERLKQALRLFGPIFTQFYGQTEAPMVLTALSRQAHMDPDEDEAETLVSAGRAAYQAQLRLVDDDGRDAAPGELGEVVTRSLNMMTGYLDNPEATAATIRDGWLQTGDIARIGASGLITIVDRKKDMIVSGGFNVYPREVEDALAEHPAVRQAAVIGVPHEKWGEEVKAIVVLHAEAQADEQSLIEFVKSRKGSLMAPKSVEFWNAVPLTNLGKIDKKAMRARYWSGQQRKV